ncbi:MAG TPA: NHL repeat-containing protein [Pyrinomonadaceae bacterium]|nr:NHL repeat-containing protein [Pyrinomonadaceae bacterium]
MKVFTGQTRPRRRIFAGIVLAILSALVAATLLLLYFYKWRDERRPTVADWRASVRTFAGDGSPGAQDDAQPTRARFQEPFGVALDREGNVYVSDAGDGNRIRKVSIESGAMTTVAGGREGYADATGAAASFNTPSGLAVDRAGNLYVADTGNNRIRRVTPEGAVTTVAGDGEAGYRDGEAARARFNGPVGVAVDDDGNVYVADTYNDRIRLVTPEGEVSTIAGGDGAAYTDGPGEAARFDTPCAVAASAAGDLFVADTGNNRLRKITRDRQVSTLPVALQTDAAAGEISRPTGLVLTHDGFLYVTEGDRGRVVQIAPDGVTARVVAGQGAGFANGDGRLAARFNQPAGIAIDRAGALYVADSANFLVRKLVAPDVDESAAAPSENAHLPESNAPESNVPESADVLPRLSAETVGVEVFPWPVAPQQSRHELVATMGEVRGSYDTTDSRHHLHSGVDVFGVYGETVRAVREEKVASPLSNWGFGGLNEGLRVHLISYVHLRVGRNEKDEMLPGSAFVPVRDAEGKISRVRVKRGTRIRAGDALGTINKMYHVHMNYGPPGAEVNPLVLPLAGFSDHVAPKIEREGVQLFDEAGARLTSKRGGHLVVRRGKVRIVVDAYDQVDGNQTRRRLGLYKLGYQLLRTDGAPAAGFDEPRVTIEFDRLPAAPDAVKIAYADESGITVYGSSATRFLYEVTNTVRGGRASGGRWDASELPPGDYLLRIYAADFAGNVADEGRDVSITVE